MQHLDSMPSVDELSRLVGTQLQSLFSCSVQEREKVEAAAPAALDKTVLGFQGIRNKYYRDDAGGVAFNPFHSGQNTIFLYHLSRTIWKDHGGNRLADKVYYLNKALNGLDLFYEVKMPSCFFVEHPVGSVIGRGTIGEYLVVQQGCTIGGNRGVYPVLGEFVWLFAQAMVLGASRLGNNVFVAAGTIIKDEEIPDNSIVFGRSPDLVIKRKPRAYFLERSPFLSHHCE